MTLLLGLVLIPVLLGAGTYLIKQYMDWRETPEERRLRELDPLTRDDWNVRR